MKAEDLFFNMISKYNQTIILTTIEMPAAKKALLQVGLVYLLVRHVPFITKSAGFLLQCTKWYKVATAVILIQTRGVQSVKSMKDKCVGSSCCHIAQCRILLQCTLACRCTKVLVLNILYTAVRIQHLS